MKAHEIAARAAQLIGGERELQHGSKHTNFSNIKTMWNAYQSIRRQPYAELSDVDAAYMMALMKIARSQTGRFNPDDALDAIGYLAIAGELDATANGSSGDQ